MRIINLRTVRTCNSYNIINVHIGLVVKRYYNKRRDDFTPYEYIIRTNVTRVILVRTSLSSQYVLFMFTILLRLYRYYFFIYYYFSFFVFEYDKNEFIHLYRYSVNVLCAFKKTKQQFNIHFYDLFIRSQSTCY